MSTTRFSAVERVLFGNAVDPLISFTAQYIREHTVLEGRDFLDQLTTSNDWRTISTCVKAAFWHFNASKSWLSTQVSRLVFYRTEDDEQAPFVNLHSVFAGGLIHGLLSGAVFSHQEMGFNTDMHEELPNTLALAILCVNPIMEAASSVLVHNAEFINSLQSVIRAYAGVDSPNFRSERRVQVKSLIQKVLKIVRKRQKNDVTLLGHRILREILATYAEDICPLKLAQALIDAESVPSR